MKKILFTILFALLPAHAMAQGLGSLDASLQAATAQTDPMALPAAVYQAIAIYLRDNVFVLLTRMAIALAIIFIFYGAMQYFTAYGDENRATNAKKTITYAFLGLIIAFMSMGIAGLVQQSITNSLILHPVQQANFQVTNPNPPTH